MSQCIHLTCTRQAWKDPENNEHRSNFCLNHAYQAVRGGMVFTARHWEEYIRPDVLVPEQCGHGKALPAGSRLDEFPLAFQERTVNKARAFFRKENANNCARCGKTIISKATHCGNCSRELGINHKYTDVDPIVQCQHWRPKIEHGHYYLKNCIKQVPSSELVTMPNGEQWCGPCRMTIYGIQAFVRREWGYEF
jgi:hypothetical protein